jgi:hypothetical protein
VRSYPSGNFRTGAEMLVEDVFHGERVRPASGKEATSRGGFLCYKRGAAGVVTGPHP